MVNITWDNYEDRQGREDMQVEDTQWEGNLEHEGVGGSHRAAAHMLVGKDIQQAEELADQYETSAGLAVLPSLVVAQTCHPFYPFQSCAGSALETIKVTMS